MRVILFATAVCGIAAFAKSANSERTYNIATPIRTDDGADEIQLRLVDGTVWLTQAEIATLFETTPQNITQHIRSVYDDGELTQDATCKQVLQVRQEGSRQIRRETKQYNLKVILAVGYRVRSPRGAQFRRWATETLNEYLVKGFVMNDERLKDPAWAVGVRPCGSDPMVRPCDPADMAALRGWAGTWEWAPSG